MTARSVLQLRLSPEEKARWQAEADASDLTLSEWIRGRCTGPSLAAPSVPSGPTTPSPGTSTPASAERLSGPLAPIPDLPDVAGVREVVAAAPWACAKCGDTDTFYRSSNDPSLCRVCQVGKTPVRKLPVPVRE